MNGDHSTASRAVELTAASVLTVTAASKLIAVMTSGNLLDRLDVLLGLPYRYIFIIVAAIELVVAHRAIFSQSPRTRYVLLLWLGCAFTIYRLFAHYAAPGSQCPCVANAFIFLTLTPDQLGAVSTGAYVLYVGALAGLAAFRLTNIGHSPDPKNNIIAHRHERK